MTTYMHEDEAFEALNTEIEDLHKALDKKDEKIIEFLAEIANLQLRIQALTYQIESKNDR